MFVPLNPPYAVQRQWPLFFRSQLPLFRLLYLSGLISTDLAKATADDVVFGSTQVNYKQCAFGVLDLVDVVETDSRKVRPTPQHVDLLLAQIHKFGPRFVCVIHSKVRNALNKRKEFVDRLDYGICGALLPGSQSVFVLNYFPNGNNVRDEKKLEIFRALRGEL